MSSERHSTTRRSEAFCPTLMPDRAAIAAQQPGKAEQYAQHEDQRADGLEGVEDVHVGPAAALPAVRAGFMVNQSEKPVNDRLTDQLACLIAP